MFSSIRKNQKGQGLVEYAIILSLVAIVVIGAMRVLGPKVGNTFSTVTTALDGQCPAGQYVKDFGDGVWCTDSVTGEPVGEPLSH